MPIARLFVDQTLTNATETWLGEEQARYIGKVLRSRPGDELLLFDGSGAEYPATVVTIERQRLQLRLGPARAVMTESALPLHLLQGVSRGDRMDTVVQKATELGVQRITPVLSEFSVVRLDAQRARRRQQHWLGVARSACEQCGRGVPPVIDLPCALPAALASLQAGSGTRLMLQPGSAQALTDLQPGSDGFAILIGPEGGFSEKEQAAAHAGGFEGVSLGPRILRTETAAITALSLLQARWGDLAG